MPDDVWEVRDFRLAGDGKPRAEIVPEGDAELAAGLGQSEEGVAAVSTGIAACAAADLALGHLTADVVLRTVGVERDFGSLEHHQQLGLVGVEASEQPVEGDEAGAAREDAVEASPQGGLALLGRMIAIGFD